jgi:DNA-binding CsgD family transcriptional regulator
VIQNDEHWLALTDAFHGAAFDQHGWYGALEGLAEATGSQVGELITVGANAAVPLNIMTNMDPDFNGAFVAAGGGDPAINPRVNAGMNAPVLKVLAESDFISSSDYKRHPHYQEFACPWDIPYICLSTLERSNDMLIGLAVVRTKQQGHISDKQRAIFAMLAPHVRAAVRTQLALEGNGAALLVGAMVALSIPAFVCDRCGQVRALTPAAEQLISVNRGLQLRLGQLYALNPADDKLLKDAIAAAARGPLIGGAPMLQTVVIRHGAPNALSMVLDVITLPAGQFELSFAPRVMVLARGERGPEGRRAAILRTAYALTSAETEVAIHIYNGKSSEAIARIRGVSTETIRSQIKSILAKLGVKRQVELVATVSRL